MRGEKARRCRSCVAKFIEDMTGHNPLEPETLGITAERIAKAIEKIAETNNIDPGSPVSEIQFLDSDGTLVAKYEVSNERK